MRCTAVKTRGPRRRTKIHGWAGLPLALLLCGCFSNEPSSDEIFDAIGASRTQREDVMPRNLNSPRVEKLGCTNPPPGMAGLLCEFQVMVNNGGNQVRYIKTTRRFVKVNGTWQTD